MKELYKSAVDKIELSDDKREEILKDIVPMVKSDRVRNYRKPLVASAIAAAFMLALFIIPTTRAGIVKAAEYFQRVFKLSDGKEVIIEKNDESTSVTFDAESLAYDRYIEVVDGRVYFKFEDQKIDITAKCSETTYYRYDYEDESGVTHIIFVGGPIDNLGWAEFLFDEDGTYITNLMHIPHNSPWLMDAAISIGVPIGNYEIDSEQFYEIDGYTIIY